MATIPVIPGVQVATKGILNKPIKDIICALLFGGLGNMLKGPLLCVQLDLNKLIDEIDEHTDLPTIQDLQKELKGLQKELQASEALMGIGAVLGRVNGAIAQVQSLLALNGMCKIPLKAPPIPNILKQIMDAEFAEMNGILNDLGRLSKPQLCLMGNGGINTGSYNPKSILGSIQKRGGRMADIPGNQVAGLKKRLQGVRKALGKSINRQLFPDFRHKHNLQTGRPYTGGAAVTMGPRPPSVFPAAMLPAGVTLADDTPWNPQWNGPYPPDDSPNLQDATTQAQLLVAGITKTASYPVVVDGIISQNVWQSQLGPDLYALAIDALTPQDPFFAQQEPVYDYCGRLVGHTSTVISGEEEAEGGDPLEEADLSPPVTNYNFVWIADRQCWAVSGVTSEQIVNGRKDVYLDDNPIIELKRSYSHTFGIPSADINGFTFNDERRDPELNVLIPDIISMAPEFYICYVDANLAPRMLNGKVEQFDWGLSRLETYELLEDANGITGLEGERRRWQNAFGTNMYFQAENKVFSGNDAPEFPSEDVWWFNASETEPATKRWELTKDADGYVVDGTGEWIVVNEAERAARWFGSSYNFNDPHVNYLAYSNEDGSVFGLLKFI